jgi:hypothetical protein
MKPEPSSNAVLGSGTGVKMSETNPEAVAAVGDEFACKVPE